MKKKIISFLLASAVAVSVSGNAFAAQVYITDFSDGTTTSTTEPSAPAGSNTLVSTPSSTATTWSLNQSSVGLKVGQTTTLTVNDPTGQIGTSSSSSNSPFTSFVYVNGVLVTEVENTQNSGTTQQALTWTSSNPNVATVENGVVTAKSLGRAVITATAADGTTSSCYANIALKGVDVSSWQKDINWTVIKNSGYDYAMIRTGYGNEDWEKQTDAYFEKNYTGAKQAGLKVGVYHYSYATTVDAAIEEAQMCLSILNGRELDYPVAFDIEDPSQKNLSPQLLSDMAVAFCQTIENAGYDAAIYSYTNFYDKLTDPRLDAYDKWVAHWGVLNPGYTKPFTMWQYGKTNIPGATNGVSDIDVNYCYYDYGGTLQQTTGGGTIASNLSSGQ